MRWRTHINEKVSMSLLIGFVVLALITGCQNSNSAKTSIEQAGQKNETSATQKEAPRSDKVDLDKLDRLVEYFKSNVFQIGKKTEKMAAMVGAINGFGITLNGKAIELYQFNLATPTEKVKKDLSDLKKSGIFTMGEMQFPAMLNKDIMILNYQNHPDKEKLKKFSMILNNCNNKGSFAGAYFFLGGIISIS